MRERSLVGSVDNLLEFIQKMQAALPEIGMGDTVECFIPTNIYV